MVDPREVSRLVVFVIENNDLLREKIAGIFSREMRVGAVVQAREARYVRDIAERTARALFIIDADRNRNEINKISKIFSGHALFFTTDFDSSYYELNTLGEVECRGIVQKRKIVEAMDTMLAAAEETGNRKTGNG